MLELHAILGRVVDVDTHEMTPIGLWPDRFGDVGALFAALGEAQRGRDESLDTLLSDVEKDDLEITTETVWKRSGWARDTARAPGAFDMKRRLAVLDVMGVQRHLVFPSFGLLALMLANDPLYVVELFCLDPSALPPVDDVQELGRRACKAYNDWAIAEAAVDPDRLRIVGVLAVDDISAMMAEAERLLAAGIRGFQIPLASPPGGKSPADQAIAPFWSLCEEADAPVFLHAAGERFLATDAWHNVPEFKQDRVRSVEFNVDPWFFATIHIPCENYLTTMILGGVFERHPNLRLGVIETGANWIGPMSENLDLWAAQFPRRMAKIISMPPSAFVARNVRLSTFSFEPVRCYFERYPALSDVYCYASDYPHIEGGSDQLQRTAEELSGLGSEVLEKFFVTNSALIMPPLPSP